MCHYSNHQLFLLKKNNVGFCFHVIIEFVEMEHQEPSGEIFDKFTWKIANFSQLNNVDKIYSEPFVLGGYPWYIWKYLNQCMASLTLHFCFFYVIQFVLL
jgi:hypothetical protein